MRIKSIVVIILLYMGNPSYGQLKIDMNRELATIDKTLIIDGNAIQAERDTREQIIITGNNMNIKDKSGFVFNNVIVMLNGSINFDGEIRPKLIDSFILCKDAGFLSSKNVIEVSNFDDINVGKTKYIKKLSGNPQLHIYNTQGKRVFKGSKQDTKTLYLPISRYDIKVVGVTFDEKVLFY